MSNWRKEWPSEVLLIEDNPADVFLIQRSILKGKWPINLHVVQNGQEGLNFLFRRDGYSKAPTPDLILLDLNLPVMDGREFMSEMLRHESICGLPVVVLTTSENESDVLRMYRLRCSAYFVKPVDLPNFNQLMDEIWTYWRAAQLLPCLADQDADPMPARRLPPKPRRVWLSREED